LHFAGLILKCALDFVIFGVCFSAKAWSKLTRSLQFDSLQMQLKMHNSKTTFVEGGLGD
jgi:hypothetical protein